MNRPKLYISHDADADWLSAIEFGSVDDGVPAERWRPINGQAAWLLEADTERIIGVRVNGIGSADLGHPDFDPFWSPTGPRFDALTLALVGTSMGEIVAAGRAANAGRSTINRLHFAEAINSTGEAARAMWSFCLDSGDLTAHYGLGIAKFELGDFDGAYRHLSYYSTLATHDAWTWCWLGRAALAVGGKQEEGLAALHRARELEDRTDVETDAAELLSWAE